LAGTVSTSLTGPTGVITSGAFTVESWVYLRSNSFQTILSEGVASPGSTVYIATISNGQIYVRWGGSESTTGVVAPTNRWVHFALTRSATGVPKFFIDQKFGPPLQRQLLHRVREVLESVSRWETAHS